MGDYTYFSNKADYPNVHDMSKGTTKARMCWWSETTRTMVFTWREDVPAMATTSLRRVQQGPDQRRATSAPASQSSDCCGNRSSHWGIQRFCQVL